MGIPKGFKVFVVLLVLCYITNTSSHGTLEKNHQEWSRTKRSPDIATAEVVAGAFSSFGDTFKYLSENNILNIAQKIAEVDGGLIKAMKCLNAVAKLSGPAFAITQLILGSMEENE